MITLERSFVRCEITSIGSGTELGQQFLSFKNTFHVREFVLVGLPRDTLQLPSTICITTTFALFRWATHFFQANIVPRKCFKRAVREDMPNTTLLLVNYHQMLFSHPDTTQ